MQQQNKRTQYSIPGPGTGAWDWVRVEYCTDMPCSEGSAMPGSTHPELSTDRPMDATAASAEALALSFGGETAGGHSATTFTAADLCGALGRIN